MRKLKKILTLILWAITTQLFAQTKLIAHKSHSGNSANFKIAMENDPLQYEGSNFGIGPEPTVTSSQLDSVVFVSDSTAIMFTSFFCSRGSSNLPLRKWRAGSEIVYKHPLFSRQHSLDSIKAVLKKDYYFKNSINKVKFVGYDNGKPIVKKEKKDTVIQPEPIVAHKQKDTTSKKRKWHAPNKPMVSNDMIWLLEMISLITMATAITFIKMR